MFDQFRGLLKDCFALRKIGEIAQRQVMIAKSCHHAAWKEKL